MLRHTLTETTIFAVQNGMLSKHPTSAEYDSSGPPWQCIMTLRLLYLATHRVTSLATRYGLMREKTFTYKQFNSCVKTKIHTNFIVVLCNADRDLYNFYIQKVSHRFFGRRLIPSYTFFLKNSTHCCPRYFKLHRSKLREISHIKALTRQSCSAGRRRE